MAKNEIVYVIKHYMLKRNGKRVYLHKDKILDNICQFVDYYSKSKMPILFMQQKSCEREISIFQIMLKLIVT